MNIWKKYKDDVQNNVPDDSAIYKAKKETEKLSREVNSTNHKLRKYGIITSMSCAVLALVICIPTVFMPMMQNKDIPSSEEETQLVENAAIDIPTASSYEAILEYLKENATLNYYCYGNSVDLAIPEGADVDGSYTPPSAEYAAGSSAQTPDYSDTNNQVEGVSEGDIIKTDGKYIYTVSADGTVNISLANNGALENIAYIPPTIDDDKMTTPTELYITDNRMIVICNYTPFYGYDTTDMEMAPFLSSYIPIYTQEIIVNVYDTTDMSNPTLIDSISQTGSYVSSRMIGNDLYLITRNYIPFVEDIEIEEYIPTITDNSTEKMLSADQIYIYPNFEYSGFLVVSGIDTDTANVTSTVSTLGGGYTVYASQNNIYVITSTYKNSQEDNHYMSYNTTLITKFSIDEGIVALANAGEVKGYILNQFSLDEYNDNLRIVTTISSYEYDIKPTFNFNSGISYTTENYTNIQHNAIFVLNDKMEIIGKITEIAEGETVYSVRFTGDLCYFVTFRQVDPLFTVDLSDPENPQILSALKITGFSNYMHPYGDGLLFGLGYDATITGRTENIKISMFDISDPTNVSEISKYSIADVYYSEASYNHKAILINAEKNIIAFQGNQKYLVFSYDKVSSSFSKIGEIALSDSNYYWGSMRGIYIGNYLYIFTAYGSDSSLILSFDLCNNFNTVDTIILDK